MGRGMWSLLGLVRAFGTESGNVALSFLYRKLGSGSADAEQVLHGQLVEALEVHAALGHRVRVVGLGAQRLERLALAQRRDGELVDAGRRERLGHLGVGAERPHLLPQD